MFRGQTQFIQQQAQQDFSISSQKELLPLMLSKITHKIFDHAFSKILCWQQQTEEQIQSLHFVRHYDLQCEGVFTMQGIFKKKIQSMLLKGFETIKQTLKINYLSVDYANNQNTKSLENSRASKSHSRISEKFDRNSSISKQQSYKRHFYGNSVTQSKVNFFLQQPEKQNTLYNTNNSFTEKKINNIRHCYTPSNGSMTIREKPKSYKESFKRLLEEAKEQNRQRHNIKRDDISSIAFRSRQMLIFENPQKTNQESQYQYQYSIKLKENSTALSIPKQETRNCELSYQKLQNFEDENNISNLITKLKKNRQERKKYKCSSGDQSHMRHYSNLGYETLPTEYQSNKMNNSQPYALKNIWSRDSLSIPPKHGFCVKDMYCCIHGRHD